jgi:excisionase family DNA binding protein
MVHKKLWLGVKEVSELLGVSRMTVIRKIKKGEIDAERVGNTYMIHRHKLPGIFREASPVERKKVQGAVERVIREYQDVLKRLGREDD